MIVDWDDANRSHVAEHNVSTEEAEQAIVNDPLDLETQEDDSDGYRYRQIGETDVGRILVLLSTVRGNAIRVITAWDAPKAYKQFYLEQRARQIWKRT